MPGVVVFVALIVLAAALVVTVLLCRRVADEAERLHDSAIAMIELRKATELLRRDADSLVFPAHK